MLLLHKSLVSGFDVYPDTTFFVLLCLLQSSFETRILIDRGECQTYAKVLGSDFMGEADQCTDSVILNLLLTLLLMAWIDYIFMCVLALQGDALPADKKETRVKFLTNLVALFGYVLYTFNEAHIDSGLLWIGVNDDLPELIFIVLSLSFVSTLIVGFFRQKDPILTTLVKRDSMIRQNLAWVYGEHEDAINDVNHAHEE